MNSKPTLLGMYWHNAATCYGNTPLVPMDYAHLEAEIRRVDSAEPFSGEPKTADGRTNDRYKAWKRTNLPILYFTLSETRPSKDDTACNPSGWAMIDIDNLPNTSIMVMHPSVKFINYTRNGAHVFVYSPSLLESRTPWSWQNEYNKIAVQIHNEIKAEHPNVKFDGNLSRICWGCYIWGGEYWRNPNSDISFSERAGDIFVTDDDIKTIYEGYTQEKESKTLKNVNDNSAIQHVEVETEGGEEKIAKTWTKLLLSLGIDSEMMRDFNHLSLKNFIHKYYGRYEPIHESKAKTRAEELYDGTVCEVAWVDGRLPKTYRPYKPENKAEPHKRRKTLYNRLLNAKQQLKWLASDENTIAEKEVYDINRLLFQAAWYAYCFLVDGERYGKNKIRRTLHSVLIAKDTEDRKTYDKRKTAMGEMCADSETGEWRKMTTNEKKANAPKAGKTKRIEKVLKQWNPRLSVKENIEALRVDGVEGTDSLNARTVIDYIKRAKNNPNTVDRHPWLADIVFGNRKSVRIRNKVSGEVLEFKSAKECYERLGISKNTYHTKFLKGNGEAAVEWEVLE